MRRFSPLTERRKRKPEKGSVALGQPSGAGINPSLS